MSFRQLEGTMPSDLQVTAFARNSKQTENTDEEKINLEERKQQEEVREGHSDRIKWYWTKWHGQNGTDKMVRTKWKQFL